MADLAFLLLIFFLIAATIDIDTGLRVQLPNAGGDPPPIRERNLLNVLVSASGTILADGREVSIRSLSEEVFHHVTNKGIHPQYADAPEYAVVSLKTDPGLLYGTYIDVFDAVFSGYQIVHNQVARDEYGYEDYHTYRASLNGRQNQIILQYPIKLSLAEPYN